jgi:hypothetical protein
MGKNKSEVIDADMLSRAVVFTRTPLSSRRRAADVAPESAPAAARRSSTPTATCAGKSLAGPVRVPDMWNAFAESLPLAEAVLGCRPRLHCSSGPQRARQR